MSLVSRQSEWVWLVYMGQAKPSQRVNWGEETCASRKSMSPCLLAIPAFDRIAGLYNRNINLTEDYTNANDFEVRLRAFTSFANDWCLCRVNYLSGNKLWLVGRLGSDPRLALSQNEFFRRLGEAAAPGEGSAGRAQT